MGRHEDTVHIVEPECRGFAHAEVNAAYLAAFALAVPSARIAFHAEEGHLARVSGILESDGLRDKIMPEPVKTPDPLRPVFRRFPLDWTLLHRIFHAAARDDGRPVIMLSVSGSNLIAAKLLLLIHRKIRCIVVVHGILEQIAGRPSLRPSRWIELPFWFRLVLPWMNSRRILYVLLSGSIRRNVLLSIPRMRRCTRIAHLPYRMAPETEDNGPARTKPSFGHFGIVSGAKGAADMIRLLEEGRAAGPEGGFEFHVVGHIREAGLWARLRDLGVFLPPLGPITGESYRERARRIDYAVFFYPRDSYRFTASAAFLDALSCVKPVIAMENDYFRYCFGVLGDIGYLCRDYDALRRKVLDLIKQPDPERYRRQQRTIMEKRGLFGIDGVARELGAICSELSRAPQR